MHSLLKYHGHAEVFMFRRLALFLISVLLFAPTPLAAQAQTANQQEPIAVAKVTFALRSDSSFTANSVATVPQNSTVTVARCSSDWCLVRALSNEEPVAGWVHSTYLDMSSAYVVGSACYGSGCRGYHGRGCRHGCSRGSRGHHCKHGRCR